MAEPPDELAMVREAAALMGRLLINRKDRKAVFRPDHKGDWHWAAVEQRFTMVDFLTHLTGQHCLGTYMLGEDSTVKFLAFDLDLSKDATYLKLYDIEQIEELEKQQYGWDGDVVQHGNLEFALHRWWYSEHRWARIILLDCIREVHDTVKKMLELPTLTIITGGGAHVLALLPEPTPATLVRSAGIEVACNLRSAVQVNDIFFNYGASQEISIEVFPKQDSLQAKPYGNLIRLPFGWHQRADIRTFAIDPEAIMTPKWDYTKISSLGALRQLAPSVESAADG